MAAKCALVVDDSKSARAFLSRILEKHLLDVDCVVSAEEAIDYLTRHRPDVIFMDHLMPGMDGFQAVQAIKNNPRTATIPILMYTSQEGELYLGQARALGALGVLPKQIRPADVTNVLAQLHLYERRESAPPTPVVAAVTPATQFGANDPTQVAAVLAAGATALPQELAAAHVADAGTGSTGRYPTWSPTEQLLRDQIAEVRRTLVGRLDELQADLPSRLQEVMNAQATPVLSEPAVPAPDRRAWLAAAGFGALALLFAALWVREHGQRVANERSLVAVLAQERAAPVPAPAGAALPAPDEPAVAGATASSGIASAVPAARAAAAATVSVPFGEQPLAGDRVGAVRTVIEDLRRTGFHGDVEVQVYQGRFCLIGSAGEGYSLPPDDLAYSRCDRVGNLSQDGGASRESLPFANMLAEQRKAAGATLSIRLVEGSERLVQPYPEPGSMPTAGSWNNSAAANNRVEIRWRERP